MLNLVQHLVLSTGEILKRVQGDGPRNFKYFCLDFKSSIYNLKSEMAGGFHER